MKIAREEKKKRKEREERKRNKKLVVDRDSKIQLESRGGSDRSPLEDRSSAKEHDEWKKRRRTCLARLNGARAFPSTATCDTNSHNRCRETRKGGRDVKERRKGAKG